MNEVVFLRTRITRLLLDGHSTIVFVLGLVGLLLSCGFLVSDFVSGDKVHYLLTNLMPFKMWALAFYIYGVIKLITSMYRTPYALKIVNIILGLWLWTYVAVSFVVFTDITLPIETIIITPILCEVWDFSMTILNKRCYVDKRKKNA